MILRSINQSDIDFILDIDLLNIYKKNCDLYLNRK